MFGYVGHHIIIFHLLQTTSWRVECSMCEFRCGLHHLCQVCMRFMHTNVSLYLCWARAPLRYTTVGWWATTDDHVPKTSWQPFERRRGQRSTYREGPPTNNAPICCTEVCAHYCNRNLSPLISALQSLLVIAFPSNDRLLQGMKMSGDRLRLQ